jgi:polysaccharide pyruvyl transferase WcaK-like protein
VSVFLEHSGHALTNLGDVAMLQAAVSRLHDRLPGARISVPAASTERLARFCPDASPLPSEGLRALAGLGYLPGRHRLPRGVAGKVARWESRVRGRAPEWLDRLALRRERREASASASAASASGNAPTDAGSAARILAALDGASLFVASGGGYITDAFADKAWSSLTLLRRAQRRGIPTALVSQGLGPLEDPALRALAARVLARADLVALRERRAGPSLLSRLGVDAARVVVTGDDAVGAAYSARRSGPGSGLGVNLRSASYAGLTDGAMAAVGAAVRRLAAELRAPLVTVPIALDEAGSDAAAIRRAVGESGPSEADPSDPAGAVARAARCRVVVTASYHAAVFALAQGIPAVGLAKTAYYADKLEGLAELFGPGAEVVRLDAPEWEARLEGAVRELWTGAADTRASLLAAAAEQVRLQDEAYARLARIGGAHEPPAAGSGGAEASA